MITLVLVLLAAISKAVMDKLQFHYRDSIFLKFDPQWWNPALSWKNKWKPDAPNKEAFLGSSTIFVMVTDAWHLFQFIFIALLLASIVIYKPMVNQYVDFIIYYVVFGYSFELCFARLFTRRKS